MADELLRELHQQHATHLLAYLKSLGWSQVDAEDITQETFTKAWRNLHTLEPGRNPIPWLYTIARRVGVDMHRKRQLRPCTPLDVNPDNGLWGVTDGGISQVIDRLAVDEELAAMTSQRRKVYVLRHMYGLTVEETADLLGIPQGTVKSTAHYGRRPAKVGGGGGG